MDVSTYDFKQAKPDFDLAREGKVAEGWEVFVDTEHKGTTCKVWRKPDAAGSGLYLYKMVGRMEKADAESFAALFDDFLYRPKWDIYTHSLQKLVETAPVPVDNSKPEELTEKGSLVQWRVKFNFPLISDREYLFDRHRAVVDGTIIFLDKQSNDHKDNPPKKHVVRIESYNNAICILQDGDDVIMSQDYLTALDLKMSLPTWLINWAAGSGIKSVLGLYKDSLAKYPAWKEKHGVTVTEEP